MTRDFTAEPLSRDLLLELLDTARHAPSAGHAQGVEFVLLSGAQITDFWDLTLPEPKRAEFPWPGLLAAPALVVPLANAPAYLARYSEPDKAHTKLGDHQANWPVPYWHIDAAFAVQNLLLLAHERGLGALFFGLFEHADAVSKLLKLPAGVEPLGAVALGHPRSSRRSQSAKRPRRDIAEVVHFGRWPAKNPLD